MYGKLFIQGCHSKCCTYIDTQLIIDVSINCWHNQLIVDIIINI